MRNCHCQERARKNTKTKEANPQGAGDQARDQRETQQRGQGADSDNRDRLRELQGDMACSGARFKIARAFSW